MDILRNKGFILNVFCLLVGATAGMILKVLMFV